MPEEYRGQLENQKPLPPITKISPGREKLYEDNAPKSDYIRPPRPTSKRVEVFVTDWCPHCRDLEAYLQKERIRFRKYDIEKSAKGKRILKEIGGDGGVPVTRIGDQVIRGFKPEEIEAALNN